MRKEIIRREINSHLGDSEKLHPVLARIYAARNVRSLDEMERSLSGLLDVGGLTNIDSAVALLVTALEQQEKILIVGDFDADGATSCAVAVRALTMLGAKHVDYLVPDRFRYGYGLTPEIVEVAAKNQPSLLVTVDNGVSSVEGVAVARSLGIKVLITDHHLQGETLPNANAIVNPNLRDDTFQSKNLAGVGVIFYVMLALRTKLRNSGWFEKNKLVVPNLAGLLDLVALGTVADVVPLDKNNRILVAQGLARIRQGHGSAGILALLQVANKKQHNLVATDLGFSIGPRLNAAGRIDDMSIGIECLLTDDMSKALTLAQKLDQLNIERRAIESDMQTEAMAVLTELSIDEKNIPVGLCLYEPSWHQGVIGILASRLKEKFNRPTVIFADAGGGEIKGSARSIPGLHIRDVFDAVAAKHPGVLSKFGGHSMAAGLTLKATDFKAFAHAFQSEVELRLTADDLKGFLLTDGELLANELNLEMAKTLQAGGPWGAGFPEPLFDGSFAIKESRVVGEKHAKLLLCLEGSNIGVEGIAFNQSVEPGCSRLKVVYKLGVNEFRGASSVQLIIDYMHVI